MIGTRFPKRRQICFRKSRDTLLELFFRQSVQHNEAFAFSFVGYGGHCKNLLGGIREFVQLIFDLDMRHHFAADFAEAAEPVGDADESIFIHGCDVAGVIPTIAQHFGGLFRTTKIALHYVGTADEQETGSSNRHGLHGIRINDPNADARQRMSDTGSFEANLPELRGAEVARVHGDGRRALGAAVPFQRTNAEAVFEGDRDAFG